MFRDWKKVIKVWWCCVLTFSLGSSLFDGTLQKNLAVIAKIRPWMVLENFFMSVVVVSVFVILIKLHPIFKWSWLYLFRSKKNQSDEGKLVGRNIMVIPIDIKWFAFVFLLLLMVNLPSMALTEEKWFRAGTENWLEGLYISFLFGMCHCLVGVPIGAGVALTLAGLWFTYHYFIGGIELSALHHTTFNLIIISILFLTLAIKHIFELKTKPR